MPRLLTAAGLHTSAFYAAFYMTTGVQLPFWPLWLEDWGLSAAEIGLYTALAMAVRIVAGLAIPALADRLDRRRHAIAVCAGLAALLYLAHLGIETRPVLLAATVAVAATMAGIGPIAEALGVAAARVGNFPYAQSRAIGSLGFLVANLAAGALIAATGAWVALPWIVGGLVAVLLLVLGHPGARHAQPQGPPELAEIGRMLTHRVFAIFMGAVAFTQASHAVMYSLGTVHWRGLGLGSGEIGALWAASVATEIVFLFTVGTVAVQRLGPVGAIACSGAAGVVRWCAMMADPTGLWLWPIQALHTLTFAMGHLGTIAFIARAVPDRDAAAAQGATSAMAVGAVMALATALAALLYPALGGLTYGVSAACSAIGLGFAWWLARAWRGEEIAI
jgi:MFS transporter, PPP family, 3-phenylpropionic acid transporter